MRRDRRAHPSHQHGQPGADETQRHHREHGPAEMTEPRQRRDGGEDADGDRYPGRGERGHVGDHGRRRRGHADGDRQDEVHDQRADGDERPAFAERRSGGGGGPAALGEARYELVVVRDDERDDPDDERHRR